MATQPKSNDREGKAAELPDLRIPREFIIHPPRIRVPEVCVNTRNEIVTEEIRETAQAGMRKLAQEGHLATIEQVTARLNRSGIDHPTRFLLASADIYLYLLNEVFHKDQVKDVAGVYTRITTRMERVTDQFFSGLTKAVLDKNNIVLQAKLLRRVMAEVVSAPPPLDKVESTILEKMNYVRSLGRIPELIDAYFDNNEAEVDISKGTPEVKRAMANYLADVGLNIPDSYDVNKHHYDEALFVAFNHVTRHGGKDGDPINNIYSSSASGDWDFQVDTFESTEGQGIDSDSIKVASVLYYTHVLGDRMGIFRVADAILMAWTQGRLDIPQGATSDKLYRYYKKKEDRATAEERGLFYAQVLNIGNVEMLEGMTTNTDFTRLWNVLMEEVVSYIQKFEASDTPDSISKMPVYRAMQDIQYNLTTHTSGMVKAMTKEMYAHLQSAIDILREQSVVDQLGHGYNKSMWKVVERVSQSEFNTIPNVSALKTAAVEGHKVLRTIADFDEASFKQEDYTNFLNACEAFIIAQSQLGNVEDTQRSNGETDEFEETEATIDSTGDDWDF